MNGHFARFEAAGVNEVDYETRELAHLGVNARE